MNLFYTVIQHTWKYSDIKNVRQKFTIGVTPLVKVNLSLEWDRDEPKLVFETKGDGQSYRKRFVFPRQSENDGIRSQKEAQFESELRRHCKFVSQLAEATEQVNGDFDFIRPISFSKEDFVTATTNS